MRWRVRLLTDGPIQTLLYTVVTKRDKKKDLGVAFDENLQFKTHINQITHKANNVLGIIKRTFNSRDPAVI